MDGISEEPKEHCLPEGLKEAGVTGVVCEWFRNNKMTLNPEKFKYKCKHHIIHSPHGFSGIIYNTGWGTLPDCLRCSLQVVKE